MGKRKSCKRWGRTNTGAGSKPSSGALTEPTRNALPTQCQSEAGEYRVLIDVKHPTRGLPTDPILFKRPPDNRSKWPILARSTPRIPMNFFFSISTACTTYSAQSMRNPTRLKPCPTLATRRKRHTGLAFRTSSRFPSHPAGLPRGLTLQSGL